MQNLEYSGGGTEVLLADLFLVLKDGRRYYLTSGEPTKLGPLSLGIIKMLRLPPQAIPEKAPGPGLPVREGLNLRVTSNEPGEAKPAAPLPPMANSPKTQELPLD